MTTLPRIADQDCLQTLERAGSSRKRQTGSHVVRRRNEPFPQVVVPDPDELDRGTLRAIIRRADLSVEEFLRFL